MQTDLAIIIVNHNSGGYLKNCLNSIYAQDWAYCFQVLVIDNHSTTDKVDFMDEYPAVTLIENSRNEGFSAANNLAINMVNSQFVLLLNPDIELPPSGIDEFIRFFVENRSIGMMGPKLVRPNGSLDAACRRLFPKPFDIVSRLLWLDRLFPNFEIFTRYSLTTEDPNCAMDVECISGAFMLVRRSAITDVGGFDDRFFLYAEDLDWSYRFILSGWRVYYQPMIEVLHHKYKSSGEDKLKTISDFYAANLQLFEKYYSSNGQIVVFETVRLLILARKYISLAVWTLFKIWI